MLKVQIDFYSKDNSDIDIALITIINTYVTIYVFFWSQQSMCADGCQANFMANKIGVLK